VSPQAALDYLLTGSMASHCWRIPRTTYDLDFVVQLTPSAVPKLIAAGSALADACLRRWAGDLSVGSALEKFLRGEIRPKRT